MTNASNARKKTSRNHTNQSLLQIRLTRQRIMNGLNHMIFRFHLVWSWSVKKLKNRIRSASNEKIENTVRSITLFAVFLLTVVESTISNIRMTEKMNIGIVKIFRFVSGGSKSRSNEGFCSSGIILPFLFTRAFDNPSFISMGRNILSLMSAFLSAARGMAADTG
jgi:hypothetical protein